MMRYGSKVILMDATHGTTQYDFHLISILVTDDFEEGLHVACIYISLHSEKVFMYRVYMCDV